MEYWIGLSSVATAIIAIFTGVNIWLVWKIKVKDESYRAKDEEYRQSFIDLMQALTISNLISEKREPEYRIVEFKRLYKGKTPIFEEGAK